MAFVVDASVMVSWHFPDERNAFSDQTLEMLRRSEARLPAIWWFELRNVLLIGERRKRVTAAANDAFLDLLTALRIRIDDFPDDRAVLSLARRHRLSFYDAAYLELAARERLPLAILDRALADAAVAEGVALIGAA